MRHTLIGLTLLAGGCLVAPIPFNDVAHAAELCPVTTTFPDGSTLTVWIECLADSDTTTESGGLSGTPGLECTPWVPIVGDLIIDGKRAYTFPFTPTTRVAADFSIETYSTRECTPGGTKTGWISSPTPRSVAGQAERDLQSKGLPSPVAITGPPLNKMIVNFETWIAVQPENSVTVTATAGGITASVTATPAHIEFRTGTISTKDVAVVTCDPWGSIDYGACTWTPRFPSVELATGTTDLTYHGSISIIWNVSWTSSTGAGGSLDPMTTTTPLNITVMEIQTIGSATPPLPPNTEPAGLP
jgi:hypothetical protein